MHKALSGDADNDATKSVAKGLTSHSPGSSSSSNSVSHNSSFGTAGFHKVLKGPDSEKYAFGLEGRNILVMSDFRCRNEINFDVAS